MGTMFSAITDNLPNMSGIKSYLDPTAKSTGFSNNRANIAVKASKIIQAGRSVDGLTNITNAKSALFKVANAADSYNDLKYMGLIPGYNPKFKMPKANSQANRSRRMTNEQREKDNKRSLSEKALNLAKGAQVLIGYQSKIRANNEKHRKSQPPQIEPKGEFAILFGPVMKTLGIENATRDNFFDTFLNKILSMSYIPEENSYNKEKQAVIILKKFRVLLISKALTYEDKKKLEEITKQIQELKNQNHRVRENRLKLESFPKTKKILEERIKNIQEIIKDKKSLTSDNKNKLQKILVIKKDFVDIRFFIEQNIEEWVKIISEKIKELNIEIKKINENRKTPNEKMVENIEPIINRHLSYIHNIKQLLGQIKTSNKSNKNNDFEKIIKMTMILEKIISKNTKNYNNILLEYAKSKKNITTDVSKIDDEIKKVYKYGSNKKTDIDKLLEYDAIKRKVENEIKEMDIHQLLQALNDLFKELYTKYLSHEQNIPEIKNVVPNRSRHGSIKYKEISNNIGEILLKIPEDDKEKITSLFRLKIIIDEFMGRIGGTNFEKTKYELFSSKIDFDLKSRLKDNFETELSKLRNEYNRKTIEELKDEANKLFTELSGYLPNSSKIIKIGNIQGNTKVEPI